MSINKLISIRNPIIDAQNLMGIDHDKDIPFMTRLATQAEKQIDSYYQYERAKMVLDIKDCIAYLPNDCVMVEGAIMGSHADNCNDIINQWCGNQNNVVNFGSNGVFLAIDITGNTNGVFTFGRIPYSYQNNKLLFNNNGMCGNQITIQYLKYKTDCDGFLEISENHVEAIKWYICWHYSLKELKKNPTPTYMDREFINTARQEWNRECAHSRAQDSLLTESERREMVYSYHNPWSGHGLWQGMNTTLGNNFRIW